jgi:hypothetical protein
VGIIFDSSRSIFSILAVTARSHCVLVIAVGVVAVGVAVGVGLVVVVNPTWSAVPVLLWSLLRSGIARAPVVLVAPVLDVVSCSCSCA